MNILSRTLALVLVTCFGGVIFYCSSRAKHPPLATVQGRIIDATSMEPLADTLVSWGGESTTSSDHSGHYGIKLPIGIRQLKFSPADRTAIVKTLILRKPDLPVVLDVLIPRLNSPQPKVLALERGSRLTPEGQDLASDVGATSSISLADGYGNDDTLLSLQGGRMRVHSPIWMSSQSILFAREGVLHNQKNINLLGVFKYDLASARIDQLVSHISAHYLDLAADHRSLLVADQKALYTLTLPVQGQDPRQIFRVEADQAYLLSAAWGPDDRIYFTVDDSFPVDDRRSLTRSRIASINSDGSGLNSGWQRDADYSYRYPTRGADRELLFARFSLDGREQTLWSRNPATSSSRALGIQALRPIHDDVEHNHFYYIYQGNLHLRDTKIGSDWVILNSVKEADFLH